MNKEKIDLVELIKSNYDYDLSGSSLLKHDMQVFLHINYKAVVKSELKKLYGVPKVEHIYVIQKKEDVFTDINSLLKNKKKLFELMMDENLLRDFKKSFEYWPKTDHWPEKFFIHKIPIIDLCDGQMKEKIKESKMNIFRPQLNFRNIFGGSFFAPYDVNLDDIGGEWIEELYFNEDAFKDSFTKSFTFEETRDSFFDFSDNFLKENSFYLRELKKINIKAFNGVEKFEVKFNQSFFSSLRKILRKEVDTIKKGADCISNSRGFHPLHDKDLEARRKAEDSSDKKINNSIDVDKNILGLLDFLEEAKEKSVFEIRPDLDFKLVKYYYDKDLYFIELTLPHCAGRCDVALNEVKKTAEALTLFAKEKPGVFVIELKNHSFAYDERYLGPDLEKEQKSIMKFYARQFMCENPDSKNVFLIIARKALPKH